MIYLIAEWFGEKIGRFVLWCRWVPIVMTCRHILKRDVFNECEINTCKKKVPKFNGIAWVGDVDVAIHRKCSIDDCPKLNRQK